MKCGQLLEKTNEGVVNARMNTKYHTRKLQGYSRCDKAIRIFAAFAAVFATAKIAVGPVDPIWEGIRLGWTDLLTFFVVAFNLALSVFSFHRQATLHAGLRQRWMALDARWVKLDTEIERRHNSPDTKVSEHFVKQFDALQDESAKVDADEPPESHRLLEWAHHEAEVELALKEPTPPLWVRVLTTPRRVRAALSPPSP